MLFNNELKLLSSNRD